MKNFYYLKKIKDDLSLRQKANPSFSMRAYAKYIEVHPATLTQIFKGNRTLPFKNAKKVIEKLNLGPQERTLFMESLFKTKISLDKIEIGTDISEDRFMLDESHFKVMSEWEHLAFLDLFDLKDFILDYSIIAKKLAITVNRVEVVVDNLITCGLLAYHEGKLVRVHSNLRTTEDYSNQALKNGHKETLEMGIDKLDKIDIDFRDYSSTTVAIDLAKLPEAKTIIREFRQKMVALLRDGEKTEVYQLAIQFFPLTERILTENKTELLN